MVAGGEDQRIRPRCYGSPLDLVAGLMMDSTFIHVLNFAELPPLVLDCA